MRRRQMRLSPCGVEMQVQDPGEAPSVEERQRDPLDQTFGLRQLRRLPFLFRQRLLFFLLNPLLFSGRDYNFAWLARRRGRPPFGGRGVGPAESFPRFAIRRQVERSEERRGGKER